MTGDPPDPLEVFRILLDRAQQNASPYSDRKSRATEAVSNLSEPEKRMLSQIVAGWSDRDIAADHGVEIDVLESQRALLFRKINARSTSDAVRTGIYAGLG